MAKLRIAARLGNGKTAEVEMLVADGLALADENHSYSTEEWQQFSPESWQQFAEKQVGAKLTCELVEELNWAFAEMEKQADAAIPGDTVINWLDDDTLANWLERSDDAELRKHVADKIRSGGFAARKSLDKRIDDGAPLTYAIMDLELIEPLLQQRLSCRRRVARAHAKLVVAFHYMVPLQEIEKYLKRGKNDPHRVV